MQCAGFYKNKGITCERLSQFAVLIGRAVKLYKSAAIRRGSIGITHKLDCKAVKALTVYGASVIINIACKVSVVVNPLDFTACGNLKETVFDCYLTRNFDLSVICGKKLVDCFVVGEVNTERICPCDFICYGNGCNRLNGSCRGIGKGLIFANSKIKETNLLNCAVLKRVNNVTAYVEVACGNKLFTVIVVYGFTVNNEGNESLVTALVEYDLGVNGG